MPTNINVYQTITFDVHLIIDFSSYKENDWAYHPLYLTFKAPYQLFQNANDIHQLLMSIF